MRSRSYFAMPAVRLLAGIAAALLLAITFGLLVMPSAAEAATKPPASLRSTTQTATSLSLAWSKVSGAAKYRVKYSTSSTFSKPKYREMTTVSTKLTGLKANTTYYLQVRVITKSGKSVSSYSKSAKAKTTKAASSSANTTPAPKPAAPTATPTPSASPSATATPSASPSATATPSVTPSATATPSASPSTSTSTGASALRVGSYNVRCASCFVSGTEEGTWFERRDAIVSTIKSQDLDVLGVQEASQGRLKDSNGTSLAYTQFEDLATRLGSPWKLTNTKRYNCVKDTTPTNCVYQYQGASQGTRLLYNSDRLELVKEGSKLLPETDPSEAHYVTWAILRQLSTGRQFLIADSHLIPDASNAALRQDQAETAVATIKANNPGKLPMIAVGDWNSGRFDTPSNTPYDVYVKSGFVDPLGGSAGTTKTAPGATAEKRINTWLNSFNGFLRKANGHPTWINGTYIDYLMTTSLRVSEWETVANLDANGNFVGRIPSDHNMIRATVWLPATS